MSLLETVLNASGGQEALAKKFGLNQDQVSAALGQLVPSLSAGVKKNASQQGGMESLLGALQGGNHQQYIDQPERLADEGTAQEGNAILGHLFGSKDVSRGVAEEASKKTGIDANILKQMLPVAATMLMGSMSKKQSEAGAQDSAGAGSLISGLLDSDDDGSVADDVVGMFKKFL